MQNLLNLPLCLKLKNQTISIFFAFVIIDISEEGSPFPLIERIVLLKTTNKKGNKMKTTKVLKSAGRFIKKHNKAIICVGGAIIAAPFALAAAPVIAASAGAAGLLGSTATTGTLISTLGGASLTNASLAAIGNGALIIGGGGMAGGTAVIGTAGAAAGAGAGAAAGKGAKSIYNVAKKKFTKAAK